MSKEKEEVKQEGDFKMKVQTKKPKKLNTKQNEPIKVDLSDKEETKVIIDAVQEPKSNDSDVVVGQPENKESSATVVEEVRTTEEPEEKEVVAEKKDQPIATIEEIPAEEVKEIHKEIKQELQQSPGLELPENVEKLVQFMKETGGTVEDYVRLNVDYSDVDDSVLLREYYKKSKPHLNLDEIDFVLEDKFSYDEDVDDERDIKKKKLAMKEEIARARGFLDETKQKYYDEIKLRPGVTQEQQRAMDFFDRYNKDQEVNKKHHEDFKTKTKKYFNEDFKGFDFSLGEKKFRYKVNNPTGVSDAQSNINNFVKKFLNEDGSFNDYEGYHKALYAARNADTIANHFYEQGKADAIRDVNAKSKNISNEPRVTSSGDVYINGLKVKAINGVDSSRLKIKNKNQT